MAISKYVIYECDTCQRQVELLLDGKRPDPLRCNITLACRGKLSRVGLRSSKEFLFTPIVPGLADYVPRGTPEFPAPTITDPVNISLFTANGSGMLTLMAVKRRTDGADHVWWVTDSDSNSFDLEVHPSSYELPVDLELKLAVFEITPQLLQYKRYTYVVPGAVQVVSGADDSPEGRNLRFTVDNQLRVFANGVQLDPSAYDRTVDDQVTFTPAIFDTNNVIDVLVYDDIDTVISSTSLIKLSFVPLVPTVENDLALRSICAWGDYGTVIPHDGNERVLLYCSNLAQLSVNKSYGVAQLEATSVINPSDTRHVSLNGYALLTARAPCAFQDKELHAYLSGEDLETDDAVLNYRTSAATGELQLSVDSESLTQTYNPLKLGYKITQDLTASSQDGTALPAEELPPQYILGPS